MKEDKRTKRIVLLCLVAFIAVMVYAYMAFVSYHNGMVVEVQERGDEAAAAQLADGVEFESEFTVNTDKICGVVLYFDTQESLINGIVRVALADETGSVLAEAEKTGIIDTDGRFVFSDAVSDIFGKRLTLRITCSGFETSENALLLCAESGADMESAAEFITESAVQKQKQKPAFSVIMSGKDSFFTLQNIVYIVLILVVLGVFSAVLFCRKEQGRAEGMRMPMERIYLIAGLGMGLIFMLIIPLMAVPDESVHLYTAYDVSNTMLGVHADTVSMRAEDAQSYYNAVNLQRNDYVSEYDGIFSGIKAAELIPTNLKAAGTPRYIYIVPALGITLGRLLGFGTTLTYLLGRLFNMLMFVAAVYYAIKKIPFGKGVVFVWALLPITLQQTSSFSYDAPIYSLSILVIATTLKLTFSSGETDPVQSGRLADRGTKIVLFLSCLLLLPCKGYAFLPLVVLPLMLLPRLWREHRDSRNAIKEKIKPWMKLIFWGIAAALFVAACILAVRILRNITAPENINNNYIAWANQNGYTVGYFIKNPVSLLEILINTAWFKGDMYLSQMLGGSLGWLEIEVPWMFVVAFLLLLVYAALRREGETQLISTGQRIWLLLVFAGVCALAAAGMLLYWTPNSVHTIEGVQGRYFLPALTLGVLALRTKKTTVSSDADDYVMLWTIFLQIFVVTAVFKNIL